GSVRVSHSFPTRRSSDLALAIELRIAAAQTSNDEARAWALNNAAYCYREMSRYTDAKASYAQAITLAEKIGRVSMRAKMRWGLADRKSTRLNSSHQIISY